jgi:hypothetical protein
MTQKPINPVRRVPGTRLNGLMCCIGARSMLSWTLAHFVHRNLVGYRMYPPFFAIFTGRRPGLGYAIAGLRFGYRTAVFVVDDMSDPKR